MDPTAEMRSLARQQYENVRRSLTALGERVAARYGDEEMPARASFDRFLGSLDRFAGWLLADEEISRRGQALMGQTRCPASPGEQDPREQDPREQDPARPAAAEGAPEQPRMPDEPAAKGGPVDVTFTLPADVQADSVVLCGEFNQWSVEGIQLERDSDGTWRAIVALEPGRSYRYRYMLDGERWENAWHADRYTPNPYGGVDSVIIVDPLPES